MGDARTDERDFLETLYKRSGDAFSQSTPIKSRRTGTRCAAADTSYDESHEDTDSIELFDLSHCSDGDDRGFDAKDDKIDYHEESIEVFSSTESGQEALLDDQVEHHEESIEVFDASYCSENGTETNVEKSSSEPIQDSKSHVKCLDVESIEVFDTSCCSKDVTCTETNVEKSSSEALLDRKCHDNRNEPRKVWDLSQHFCREQGPVLASQSEHHEESIEVFEASYCSENGTETNVEKSSSEPIQDSKSHGHANLPAQLAGKRVFIAVNPTNGVYMNLKKALPQCIWSEFLEKHVDVIIVDKRQYQDKHCLPIAAKESRVSRMIKKTVEKPRSGSSSVMEIGKKWNIPIYDYRSILAGSHFSQIKLKACSKTAKVRTLKSPFIKVEDRSRRYKPYFVEMKTHPFVDFEVPIPKSPFDTWYSKNAPVNRKGIPSSRICGLCHGAYFDLDSHLASSRHKAAANDDSLFEGVDHLIACGTSLKDFVKKMDKKETV